MSKGKYKKSELRGGAEGGRLMGINGRTGKSLLQNSQEVNASDQ